MVVDHAYRIEHNIEQHRRKQCTTSNNQQFSHVSDRKPGTQEGGTGTRQGGQYRPQTGGQYNASNVALKNPGVLVCSYYLKIGHTDDKY